mgnify:FL=1
MKEWDKNDLECLYLEDLSIFIKTLRPHLYVVGRWG